MILSEPTQPNVQNVIPLLCLYVSMFMKFKYEYRNAGNFRGRKFSRLTPIKTFRELNFEDCL